MLFVDGTAVTVYSMYLEYYTFLFIKQNNYNEKM